METLKKISVTSAFFLPEVGLIINVENRADDFWMFLGDLVGWGRFALRNKRKPGCLMPTAFELVEVHPVSCPAPSPAVYIPNALWRRKEALEAEQCTPFFEALADVIVQETSQPVQEFRHECAR